MPDEVRNELIRNLFVIVGKKAGLEEVWIMNDASKRENPGTEIRCYIGVSERA